MSQPEQNKKIGALILGAIGVVYGDIGTSPLYAMKETFAGHHPMPVLPDAVFGVLSLIFWTVLILVTLKYVLLIMRADNHGEGGSLALLALVNSITRDSRLSWLVAVLGIFAAALFYGDSMITPAISVLSAVEGMLVISPGLKPFVIPMTVVILTALFMIQRRGTGAIGIWFGPVMCLWFLSLAVLGVVQIVANPSVLLAVNPLYAIEFVVRQPWVAFLALGSVVLAVTGGEALYTDMGHFGRFPIRITWFTFAMPALLLNYFGQGALLLAQPGAIENPFFLLAPDWARIPMVVLATLATVIASQAVISGAFSVAMQAIRMGYLPRMQIIHTSAHEAGQVYIPMTNWSLYVSVMALVIGFQSSSNLAAAYGIAVTGTMMIDTLLVAMVMRLLWRWNRWLVFLVVGSLFLVDLAFFAANAMKIPQGGWFPLLIGLVSFTLLTTWKRGRKLVFDGMASQGMSLTDLLTTIGDDIHRVEGTAVFMTGNPDGAPSALLHNLMHNQVLHRRVYLVTMLTTDTPYVSEDARLTCEDLGKGFHRLIARFGFMERPDVPKVLAQAEPLGHPFEMMRTTFYLSRELIVPSVKKGMALWREQLFALMSRNATPASEYFGIPTNRTVELGTKLEI